MPQLLHIQSSPNLSSSVSRDLSGQFVARYLESHPGTTVVSRDLVATNIPHLGIDLLGGYFGKPEALTAEQSAALRLSDELIDELSGAELIVIGAPMYNFTVPSQLKAWIDHVVRAGRTFQYTEQGAKGLLSGKKAVLLLASGGVYSEGPFKTADFQETYLRAILGFIGIGDVQAVRAEGLAMGSEAAEKAVAGARGRSAELAA